jgi:lipoate synthase
MSVDSDELADKGAKKFLDMLRKIGPHSKQILNYSYPPLLY